MAMVSTSTQHNASTIFGNFRMLKKCHLHGDRPAVHRKIKQNWRVDGARFFKQERTRFHHHISFVDHERLVDVFASAGWLKFGALGWKHPSKIACAIHVAEDAHEVGRGVCGPPQCLIQVRAFFLTSLRRCSYSNFGNTRGASENEDVDSRCISEALAIWQVE